MGRASLETTLAQLKGKDPKARNLALVDLSVNGRDSPEAARALLEVITDEGLNERAIFEAIRTLQPMFRDLLPALLAELQDPSGEVREVAARLLSRRSGFLRDEDPSTSGVLPALLQASRDPEAGVRECACDAIGLLGGNGEQVIPVLVQFLADDSPEVRCAAIHALSRRWAGAPETIAPMTALLEDPDPRTRRFAARAIAEICIRRPETMEARIGTSTGTDQQERAGTVSSAGDNGSCGRTVRETLLRFLDDSSTACVFAVLKALTRLPALTPSEMTAIRALREHKDPDLRALARVTTEEL